MSDPRLRLFLASPSDVKEERDLAREVIGDFNRRVSDNLGMKIDLIQWEDATPDLGEPQDLINEKAKNSDLVVVILWRRVGTKTREHPSGTLEEFENARKEWAKTGRPGVWVYFRDIDKTFKDDPGPQLQAIIDFRSRFETGRFGLSSVYQYPAEFRYRFQTHLYQRIIESVLPTSDDVGEEKLKLGIAPVVWKTAREDINALLRLRSYPAVGHTFDQYPIVINPPRAPVDVYAAGMQIVEERFWTTAFFDSAYWGGAHPGVLSANQRMLARLKGEGKKGSARRLFITTHEPLAEATWFASQIKYLRQHGREEEATERTQQFTFLRNTMSALSKSGFDIKVGTDRAELYKGFVLRIDGAQFSPYKFGLTIYDNKRIDVFQEGKMGLAGNVNCFTPAMSHFQTLLVASEDYFNEIWQSAVSFSEFLEKVDAATAAAETKPAYRSNISSDAPWEPVIGYSRAVRVMDHVYVAGTTAANEEGKPIGGNDPYQQAKYAISKIARALNSAGAGLEDVVRTRVLVTNIDHWKEVARAHQEVFGPIQPACTLVAVSAFVERDLLVEIEAEAVIGCGRSKDDKR